MKALIIYDSYFGNTEKIAQSLALAFNNTANFEIQRINSISPSQLKQYQLIILGSPTRGFKPSEGSIKFINGINDHDLEGIKIATFDTRIWLETIKSRFARKMVDVGGYAAKQLAKRLEKKGATSIVEPEGFFVMDTEGPLKEGELERAELWGQEVLKAANTSN